MTWLRIFWIFLLPLVAFLPSFLPELAGRPLGGLYRQALVQRVVDLLPADMAAHVADWFGATSVVGELVLVFLIVLNLAALVAWPLWLLGEGVIRLSNWSETTHMGLLRKGLRRS